MVGHGSRSCVKPSVSGGFWCVVCNNLVHTGDQVVGVRNVNNPGRNGWDHVHEGCAAEYVSPPLSSEVPSERADLPLDPARAPRSEEASSAAPLAEEVEYIRLASTLQQEVATLTQQLRELEEVVASTSSIKTTLQQEVATLTQQLQAEQTLRGAAERRAEEAGHEMARHGEALAAAAAEQAKAAAANEE